MSGYDQLKLLYFPDAVLGNLAAKAASSFSPQVGVAQMHKGNETGLPHRQALY